MTPSGSMIAVDERGIGLRATWRLEHGFVNLSIWRADRCVETFHLTPADAARFVSFFVEGLAATAPAAPVLRLAPDTPTAPDTPAPPTAHGRPRRARALLARMLRRAADRLTP